MKTLICILMLTSAAAAEPSPAEKAAGRARQAIVKDPARAEGYNALALAMARRARETGDPAYYDRASEALKKSFELQKDNFEGRKALVWIELGRHEFAAALKLAKELNREIKDDVMVYGLLADAHTELGNYREAEEAVQWMLNIGRSSIPGITRAAHLRELFGDLEGALQLITSAYHRLHPAETEDRAWVLTQAAHLELLAGRPEAAERLLVEALHLFPDYHYALAKLAQVRSSQGRHEEAASLMRRRYEMAPHPENLYDLATAMKRAGRDDEARRLFTEFEEKARAEMKSWDNANRELVFYYLDHAGEPEKGLEVAGLEARRRQDVYTLDAYAWALFRNGKADEARREMRRALAVGVRDPAMLARAKSIGMESRAAPEKGAEPGFTN
jgi:tetratricopeptide (TPR) repeat protein